jgi:hypothetical protein
MSKIYQYLDIENFELISEKLYQYVVNHTNILETKYHWNTLIRDEVLAAVPELEQSLFKVIPAKIIIVAIFYTPPGFTGGIHIDVGPFEYRFLMPVHNCVGSYTKFFDTNGNRIIEMYSNEDDKTDPYLLIEEKNPLIEIASVETIAPMIIRTKTAHGIYNNPECTGPRLTCTVGFHDNFSLETLLK